MEDLNKRLILYALKTCHEVSIIVSVFILCCICFPGAGTCTHLHFTPSMCGSLWNSFWYFLTPGSKQQLQWFLQWISIEVTELLEAENWKISWTADSGVTTVIYFWDTVVRRNLSYIMENRIASVVNRIFHSACNFREEGLHSFHAGDLCWKH